MKNIIEKIVRSDEKARKLSKETEKKRAMLESELSDAKIHIKSEYMAQAEAEIKKQLTELQKKADGQWDESSKKYKKMKDNLEFAYNANCEKWANEITARVLGQK